MLSHPQIVEAAEDEFVPMCVYNNVEGEDERVLEAFGEPSWNNPVIRVVDTRGEDQVKRNGADWTVAGVAEAMVAALDDEAPAYLELLAQEDRARHTEVETAIFGMT